MICRLCGVEKPDKHFRKYRRKKDGPKIYQRNECSSCLNKRNYERVKNKKKVKLNVPESKPEVLQPPPPIENQEEGQICRDCGVWKPLSQYHLIKNDKWEYHYKNCKVCYNYKQNKGKEEQNPFGFRYRINPNEYINDYQRRTTFELMESMGWVFDEPTGTWNKQGIKENGKFIDLKPEVKVIVPRKKGIVRSPKSDILVKHVEQIIKYLEEGKSFDELETIYHCSHTTIRKVINEYNFKKKTQ